MDTLLTALTSLAGILFLAGLNWWLNRRGRLLRGRGDPAARMRRDLPGFAPDEVTAASAGAVALARDAQGTCALALAHGDDWVVRRIGPGDVRALERTGATLRLRLADPDMPRIDMAFATADLAGRWRDDLEGASSGDGVH